MMARKQLTIWNTLPIGILYGLAAAGFPTVAVHAGTAIPSGATVTIDAHGVCKKVTNPGSGTRMVFADSSDEWANFRSNPNGLTMNACAPSCGGKVVGGYCWYLGAKGEDCDSVCSSRGGCNIVGTREFAGSGGTNQKCTQVVSALLGTSVPFGQTFDDSPGNLSIGCNLQYGKAMRFTKSTICQNNYFHWVERACACNN